MTRANLSLVERAISAELGVVLLERGLAGSQSYGRPPEGRRFGGWMLAAAGLELIRRGISGYCPVSHLVGRSPPPLRASRRRPFLLRDTEELSDPVDRDSADSFPASDPPGWTPVLGP